LSSDIDIWKTFRTYLLDSPDTILSAELVRVINLIKRNAEDVSELKEQISSLDKRIEVMLSTEDIVTEQMKDMMKENARLRDEIKKLSEDKSKIESNEQLKQKEEELQKALDKVKVLQDMLEEANTKASEKEERAKKFEDGTIKFLQTH
jgi:DNA repair exonuclease SbcCD ATPase subunit